MFAPRTTKSRLATSRDFFLENRRVVFLRNVRPGPLPLALNRRPETTVCCQSVTVLVRVAAGFP
jgi:hypothetical protein